MQGAQVESPQIPGQITGGIFWKDSVTSPGTIISGGTTAGISGLIGDIQELHPDTVTTVGYLPAAIPKKDKTDFRYQEIRKTEGAHFSVRQPLQLLG